MPYKRTSLATCETCSKSFLYSPNRSNGRFCSQRCWWTRPAEMRFWSQVNKTETCWLWVGATSQDGYGKIQNAFYKRAHRLSWYLHFGAIPDEYVVHHACLNPLCVNPDHLKLLTASEHAAEHALWDSDGHNSHKTHCKRGHEFTPNNTYTWGGALGRSRACRTCMRLRNRKLI